MTNSAINPAILKIRDAIIEQALPHVIFDGWSWRTIETAAPLAGVSFEKACAVFPGGLVDLVDGFADWADRQMLLQLSKQNSAEMRVRDRIQFAIMTRLEVLRPYKEAERAAAIFWAVPTRSLHAAKIIWRTADRVWEWAGDTSSDYNRYTKRGLLSGVLAASVLAWLDDKTPDMEVTHAFVERRIENVLRLGMKIGKFRKAS